MKVQVNGTELEMPDACTVTVLIEKMGLAGKRVAVERNEELVPRSQHGEVRLSEHDRLEVVEAIGGG